MSELEKLKSIIKEIGEYKLPPGLWCLSGSAIMVAHGLDRKMGDIDIYVATRQWFRILQADGPLTISQNSDSDRWNVWTTKPYDEKRRCDPPYLTRKVQGLEVNIFHGWRQRDRGNTDPNQLIREVETVNGLPCYPLQRLLDWKIEMTRDKDVDDIPMIQAYLNRKAALRGAMWKGQTR